VRLQRLVWAAVAVALAVGLVAGAGLTGGGGRRQPLYQRTLQVAGEYRCPVCEGESVAVSQAPEAVEIRTLISTWLQQGRSPARIRSALLESYGPSILEKPPARGVDLLLWALPVVAVAAALAGLGAAFRRWRRVAPAAAAVAGAGVSDPVAAVGGAGGDDEAPAARQRPGGARQRWLLGAGLALMVLAAALWLVDRSSTQRLPGATVTGGPSGLTADLDEASVLATDDPAAALAVYDQVLASDPHQPVALTSEGYIYMRAGMPARALQLLGLAEKADPAYAPAHLYRALVLLGYARKPAAAKAELEWYLSHGPAPGAVAEARKALLLAERRAPGPPSRH
jgi:cytochrome c-type biogenesis protein CcmH/NrfF